MKVDLHVHTIYSNRPPAFMLKAVDTGECYTSPKTVYDLARGRGMDLVTISDHDTIQGALEIAHLPGTFISEEITAVFPDDGVDVHVLAFDIDEAQHCELQRLRGNIHELAAYMRAERILHSAAHPLSTEKKQLRPEHVQQLILLFKHLEGRNGTRDRIGGLALKRLLDNLTAEHIERWADLHGIEPVDPSPQRFLTAGSDDHGRLNIARAFTDFDIARPDVSAMREAFEAGRFEMGGDWGTSQTLAHNIYSVTIQYFQHTASQSAFSGILDDEEEEESAEEMERNRILAGEVGCAAGRRQQIAEVLQGAAASQPDFEPLDAIDNSHTNKAQEQIGKLGRRIVNDLFKRYVGGMIDAIKRIDLENAFDHVPGVMTAGSVIMPYLFGYRYLVRDRDDSERLVAELGFGYSPDVKPRVAVFNDCGHDINGVNIGLRKLLSEMRERGREIEMGICGTPYHEWDGDPLEKSGGVHSFEPIGEFELPGYGGEMRMGIPSLVDVMGYFADQNVSVVQLSTPGPLGAVGLLAAKLMGIKCVGYYHTEIPRFAAEITGDETVTEIVRQWTALFYRQVDAVGVPSRAAAESVRGYGVPDERIRVIPRGAELGRFDSKKRDPRVWSRFGMNGSSKVLYVGRVSREKGIDVLVDAFRQVRRKRRDAELAIVGDGPFLEELRRDNQGEGISFLGYRRDEELAELYASADVFAFPSEHDTWGNAVVEAHASGLPAVVVDRGGPAEQITDGVDGLVAPVGDAESIAGAIERLLDDPELRRSMGRAGRRRAGALTFEAAADAGWRFYMDVWGREPRGATRAETSRRFAGGLARAAAAVMAPRLD
ncbi:MAG: glycosyltransferase [Polyangia bacterium]